MTRQFIAKSLDGATADEAYALARLAAMNLSLDAWRGFVEERSAPSAVEGGVLAIQNRLGIIQGLCSYRFESGLGLGRICSADNLIAMDLMDSAAVAAALLQALEDLARRRGAAAMRLNLAHGAPATERLMARLGEKGHRPEAIGLIKNLHEVSAGS
jgi:GNAT superfamily N-acetyltransferase